MFNFIHSNNPRISSIGLLKKRGFSLIELLTIVSIMAILMSIAAPSFESMILKSKVKNASGAFVSALNIARSMAVQQASTVSLKAKIDWSNGWCVQFGTSETNCATANVLVAKVFDPIESGLTISNSGNISTLSYLPSGFRSVGSATQVFNICGSNGWGQQLTISIAGSVSLSDVTNNCQG